jgi:predicted nucleotidyltransferase
MGIAERVKAQREEILRLAAKHGAYNVRIFGSVARGEAGPESDLDVLIDLDSSRSLFDLIGFKQDLEDLLGCAVDVVTAPTLSRYIRDEVLAQAVGL